MHIGQGLTSDEGKPWWMEVEVKGFGGLELSQLPSALPELSWKKGGDSLHGRTRCWLDRNSCQLMAPYVWMVDLWFHRHLKCFLVKGIRKGGGCVDFWQLSLSVSCLLMRTIPCCTHYSTAVRRHSFVMENGPEKSQENTGSWENLFLKLIILWFRAKIPLQCWGHNYPAQHRAMWAAPRSSRVDQAFQMGCSFLEWNAAYGNCAPSVGAPGWHVGLPWGTYAHK